MHKAKNIYFLLIYKKTRWPKAGGGPRQGTFPYLCSCSLRIGDQSMKTQNWITNPKPENKKIMGWALRIVVCVCVCEILGCYQSMKTQNSTTNLPGLLCVCRIVRWTLNIFLCVQWNQSIKIKKSFKFPSILLTESNFWGHFSGDLFSSGQFFRRLSEYHFRNDNYEIETLADLQSPCNFHHYRS